LRVPFRKIRLSGFGTAAGTTVREKHAINVAHQGKFWRDRLLQGDPQEVIRDDVILKAEN
jgi:hypothetical protein